MARIRTIKPEFWSSPDIGDVSRDARLTFIGLWNIADDSGRVEAVPTRLLAELFPYDYELSTKDVCVWITELSAQGLIDIYHKGRRAYLSIRSWSEHQRIDRPSNPRCPDPEDCTILEELPENPQTELAEPSHDPREGVASPSRDPSARNVGALDRRNVGTEEDVSSEDDDIDDLFEQFWTSYPRGRSGKPGGGGAKKPALQKWRRLTDDERSECLAAVDNYRAYVEADDGPYAAHVTTWLNEERWEQWQTPAKSQNTRPPRQSCPECGAYAGKCVATCPTRTKEAV